VSGVTLSAGAQLSVGDWTYGTDYFYSNSSPGTMGSAPINQIVFSGFSGNQTYWNTNTDGPENLHEIMPIPEPATYGAILAGVSLAGIILRRRRRAAG
jgi:hypothetical protein